MYTKAHHGGEAAARRTPHATTILLHYLDSAVHAAFPYGKQ